MDVSILFTKDSDSSMLNSDSMIPLDLIRMWSERVCKFDYNQTKHWTAVCHPAPGQSSQS